MLCGRDFIGLDRTIKGMIRGDAEGFIRHTFVPTIPASKHRPQLINQSTSECLSSQGGNTMQTTHPNPHTSHPPLPHTRPTMTGNYLNNMDRPQAAVSQPARREEIPLMQRVAFGQQVKTEISGHRRLPPTRAIKLLLAGAALSAIATATQPAHARNWQCSGHTVKESGLDGYKWKLAGFSTPDIVATTETTGHFTNTQHAEMEFYNYNFKIHPTSSAGKVRGADSAGGGYRFRFVECRPSSDPDFGAQ